MMEKNLNNQSVATVNARPKFGLCPDLSPRASRRCVVLRPENPPKRPDPSLYSQERNFLSGQPLNWDSPDIITNHHNGGLWPYIEVTVRNLSADAPALGTRVRLDWSPYGIGFERSELFSMTANLNRAGMANSEVKLQYPTPTWLSDAHQNICVRAMISHPHDRDLGNNTGEQSYSGSVINAGGTSTFEFILHNSLSAATGFQLYVQESDWGASLDHATVDLMPGQNTTVTLSVNPPSTASGTIGFNIIATENGQLYGGIHHDFSIA